MERISWRLNDLKKFIQFETDAVSKEPPKSYLNHRQGKLPVVLIPGIFEKWVCLKKIADKLSDNGHDIYVIPELGWNLYTFTKSIKIIEAFVKNSEIDNFVVFAHSKGSLYGKQLMMDGKAKKMFAISSPFSGTELVKYIPLTFYNEIRPGSKIIEKLNHEKSVNKDIVSLYPKIDNRIPGGSFLEGAENIMIPMKGHHKILEENETVEIALKKMKEWERELHKN